MIKVTVLYPNGSDAKFDMNYYVTKHMPLVRERCARECRSIAAEGGVGGGAPGSPAPYIAAFQKAFTPHMAEIMGDIPNYTNTSPVIQIERD
jgi:uncharacterized protein (TIGR02118 family)